MAYKFRLGERISDGVRRIGCEQIDQAVALLSQPSNRDRGVHEARKCLKRIRALLRLARPALTPDTFRKENRRFRDIARSLSHARDGKAVLESLAKLEALPSQNGNDAVIAAVRTRLQSEHASSGRALDQETLSGVVERLRASRRHFGQLALKKGTDRVFQGLETSYRQGRKAQIRARWLGTGDAYHEWRKSVQQHWRQMQLLTDCWPAALEVRAGAARELSQALGDDHDLVELMARLHRHKSEGADAGEMDALTASCIDRQAELRRRSDRIGARLYAERPRAFRERMQAYWRAAPDKSKAKPAVSAEIVSLDSQREVTGR